MTPLPNNDRAEVKPHRGFAIVNQHGEIDFDIFQSKNVALKCGEKMALSGYSVIEVEIRPVVSTPEREEKSPQKTHLPDVDEINALGFKLSQVEAANAKLAKENERLKSQLEVARAGVLRFLIPYSRHIATDWIDHLMEIAQIEQDGCGQFRLQSIKKGETR